MHSYEIHTINVKDGKWKVDSVYDDRELAIFEARKIDEGTRYAGVKVVAEYYHEESDLTTTRTLFRGGVAKDVITKKRSASAKAKTSSPRGGTGKERAHKARKKAKAKKTNMLVPIMVLLLLLISGVAALLGLHYLQ